MFLATINKSKQLLLLSYIGHVQAEELTHGRENLAVLLDDLTAGFRLLTDLSRLDSMDINCQAEIGKIMELCEQKGIGQVIRFIPNPGKDIGLNIISLFHYRHHPRTVVCDSIIELAKLLSL